MTFAAGEKVTKTQQATIKGDTIGEAAETFALKLSAPTGGATIADDNGVATIVNDDLLTYISVDDVFVVEATGAGSHHERQLRRDPDR